MSETDVDLTFVTTGAMWAEMSKRFRCALFIAEEDMTDTQSSTLFLYRGTCTGVMGLAEYAKFRAYNLLMDHPDEENDEDDDD